MCQCSIDISASLKRWTVFMCCTGALLSSSDGHAVVFHCTRRSGVPNDHGFTALSWECEEADYAH